MISSLFTVGFSSCCSRTLWTFSSISTLADRDLDDRDLDLGSELSDKCLGSDDDLVLFKGDVGVLGELLDFELDLLTNSLSVLLIAT